MNEFFRVLRFLSGSSEALPDVLCWDALQVNLFRDGALASAERASLRFEMRIDYSDPNLLCKRLDWAGFVPGSRGFVPGNQVNCFGMLYR